jgi:putative transposase
LGGLKTGFGMRAFFYATVNFSNILLEKINQFEQLENQINLALKSKIPQRIQKGSHKIAID